MSELKIITAPSVYVIGRQAVDESELDRFLADNGTPWESDSEVGAEVLVEVGGRLCYQSFAKPRPGGNAAYIGHIKEVGHGSVCEHAAWNLLVTGVSRSLTHELVRHRAGVSPSQLSQRYVDESECAFVVPPALLEEVRAAHAMRECVEVADRGCRDAVQRHWLSENKDRAEAATVGDDWLTCCQFEQARYVRLCDHLTAKAQRQGMVGTDARKWARSAARSVLPECTETKIFLTANARALRHFLEMRGSRHADAEIRRLAAAVLGVLQRESPALFGDYTTAPLPDGIPEIRTPYRKV